MSIPSTPHNIRSDRTFPTPDLSDYIFSERVSSESPQANVTCLDYGKPHPDSIKYPNHILVFISGEKKDKTGKRFVNLYYAADRENQDDYNFVFQGFAGGGKYKSVARSYLIRRDDWEANGSLSGDLPDIAPGDPDPQASDDSRFQDYVYFGDSMQNTGSEELNSIYVMVTRLFRIHCVTRGSNFDSDTGKTYDYYESVFLADATDAEIDLVLGPVAAGENRSVQSLNCDWMVVRQSTYFDVGFSRSYITYRSMYWPPVLIGITQHPWEKLNGGVAGYSVAATYLKGSYNGPTKMRIEESYSLSPTVSSTPRAMQPTPVVHSGYKLNISIPSCLHANWTFTETYGTDDPVLTYSTFQTTTSATNYVTWPSSIVIEATSTPSKGGYINRTVTAYPPTP